MSCFSSVNGTAGSPPARRRRRRRSLRALQPQVPGPPARGYLALAVLVDWLHQREGLVVVSGIGGGAELSCRDQSSGVTGLIVEEHGKCESENVQ